MKRTTLVLISILLTAAGQGEAEYPNFASKQFEVETKDFGDRIDTDLGVDFSERTVETHFLRTDRNRVTCAIANAGSNDLTLGVRLLLPRTEQQPQIVNRTITIAPGTISSINATSRGWGARCEITGSFDDDEITVSLCELDSNGFCEQRVGLR